MTIDSPPRYKVAPCPNAAAKRAVMELNEIRYFLALSQTLNFTKAAEL
jgi:hypothetical protein